MRALACYVLIAALLCPPFALGTTPTIQVQRIDHLKNGAFKITFEDSNDGRTEVVDQDGRILLLTLYAQLIEAQSDALYANPARWTQVRNLEVSNFEAYRPLFRAAMERFLSSPATPDLSPARKSSLSTELQSLLQKPWMGSRGGRPGLNEFANQTMGVWLEEALTGMKASFYIATRTRKDTWLERRKTVPVVHNNTQFPVNLYWASRPLRLPPPWRFPDRVQLKLSPKLLSAPDKP